MKVKLILLLLLNIFLVVLASNFRNQINQAVSKAKSIYKNKYGKGKTLSFLGYDKSEYPGTNKEMRKIQQDKWDDYYECLRKQESIIGEHGSIIPEAVFAFEGESIIFECKVCISPAESADIESVEWEWSHVDAKYLEPVEYGDHILLSPGDKTLHLYNLRAENMGQYVCKVGKQVTGPYFLTVAGNNEPVKKVHPKAAPKGPHRQPAWEIHPKIMLDTMWSKWSHCSTCDKIGRKHRFGYCVIIYLANIEHETSTEETENESTNSETMLEEIENVKVIDFTINSTIQLSEIDKEFLKIFKFGIPCRSYILPPSIANIPIIRTRPSEVMTGFCKIKCPKQEVFVVKDKDGKIIETANNSAGIYSLLQGLPLLEPPVERRLQFEEAGKDIVVTCPGNLNSDTPIEWQIDSKNIIPSVLSKESNGRMFVSITDRIYINKAKISDSHLFSCWQEKKLAGTIRLVVEQQINLNFNHHILLCVLVIIMGIFVYVSVNAYSNRRMVSRAQ